MNAELPGDRIVESVQHRTEPSHRNKKRVGNKFKLSHATSRSSR